LQKKSGAHVCRVTSNISPNPSEVISEVSEVSEVSELLTGGNSARYENQKCLSVKTLLVGRESCDNSWDI
jgi:hypothetical protein